MKKALRWLGSILLTVVGLFVVTAIVAAAMAVGAFIGTAFLIVGGVVLLVLGIMEYLENRARHRAR